MKKAILILCLLPLLLLASSESFKIEGIVLDVEGLSIKNVLIKNISQKSEHKSDKNGKYKLSKVKIGDSLFFIHPLYVNKKVVISSKNDLKITLERKTERKAAEGGDGSDLGMFRASIDLVESRSASHYREDMMTSPLMAKYEGDKSTKKSKEYKNVPVGAGKLTAGEINDYSKWNLWNDLTSDEFLKYSAMWNFNPKSRYTVVVKNQNQMPIYNAKVQLFKNEELIWESLTDNTGKAELWLNPFKDDETSNNLKIIVKKDDNSKVIDKPIEINQGLNIVTLDSDCQKASLVEIAFLIDATGSMGDEIDYLKADLDNIIRSIQDTIPELSINLGISHYRDYGEEYLIKSSDLSDDINKSLQFLNEAKSGGGGDYPEAVEVGLFEVINNFSWNENSIAKVVFLILDAPPHYSSSIIDSLQRIISIASKKGIRIIPVTCSGIEKDSEFLMRSLALFTNGTYTFLTDHSGIGNPHIEPSTDKYEVETLNNLIKRLIVQYAYQPDCSPKDSFAQDTVRDEVRKGSSSDSTNKVFNLKVYPNPTQGELNIELPPNTKYFFIADLSGKIILRMEAENQENVKVNLNNLPNGVYFIVCEYENDKYLKAKFIILR